jgi:hypothetical protein
MAACRTRHRREGDHRPLAEMGEPVPARMVGGQRTVMSQPLPSGVIGPNRPATPPPRTHARLPYLILIHRDHQTKVTGVSVVGPPGVIGPAHRTRDRGG